MELVRKIRRAVRWLTWGIAALGVVASGLIIAESLHSKTCPNEALAGITVEIPGERMRFIHNDSATLSMDTVREPEGDPNFTLRPEDGHVHPHQEERFEVVKGRARFLIGDREVVLAPGEIGVVPPNTVHHWMALDGQPVQVIARFAPALDTGEWFLSFHGHLQRGEMNLLRAAVISSEYEQGTPLPASPSPVVWRILVKLLAPIGRFLGYTAC
jgi:mannose-6-phosphate isomerase-like protein (cupin superfamily)